MAELCYIQVILPLKLEWEPYYRIPEGMQVKLGDRVRVLFAGAFYVACVSGVHVQPSLTTDKIQAIEGVEDKLPAISEEEIQFWKTLSQYYLCTIGEVYKAAYPAMKNHGSRLKAAEHAELPVPGPEETDESLLSQIRRGFQADKPVLLTGVSAQKMRALYLKLAADTLAAGKSVLVLVPEIALSEAFPCTLKYHSGLSPAKRKVVEQQVRAGEPQLILGTRSALFLPFRRLGLVMVMRSRTLPTSRIPRLPAIMPGKVPSCWLPSTRRVYCYPVPSLHWNLSITPGMADLSRWAGRKTQAPGIRKTGKS